jgi:hypothetical protein
MLAPAIVTMRLKCECVEILPAHGPDEIRTCCGKCRVKILQVMATGITQLDISSADISSAGEVLVAMVERDMLCNLSRGGAGMHPTPIQTMLPFAVLQISQYCNMPLNRSTKQWSGR